MWRPAGGGQGSLDQLLTELDQVLVGRLFVQLPLKDVQAFGHACRAARCLVQALPDDVLMTLSMV